jgi:hypothetical protein
MIHREPPPGAIAPLPIWPTVAEAYRTLFANFGALAKIAALPFMLLMVINALATMLGPLGYRLVWEFGIEIPWTLMAVAWLRHLLLGQSASGVTFFPGVERRHFRFLGYALLLSVISLPLTFFPFVADALSIAHRDIVFWVLYVVALYLGVRFAFVYAAVAVDETYSLALAWRHSRAIGTNLFVAIGVFAVLPWKLFDYLLNVGAQSDVGTFFAVALAWHVGLWLLEAIYLAFIAIAFRRCTGWVAAPDQSVLERFE